MVNPAIPSESGESPSDTLISSPSAAVDLSAVTVILLVEAAAVPVGITFDTIRKAVESDSAVLLTFNSMTLFPPQ
jgi:hypothetical protein